MCWFRNFSTKIFSIFKSAMPAVALLLPVEIEISVLSGSECVPALFGGKL